MSSYVLINKPIPTEDSRTFVRAWGGWMRSLIAHQKQVSDRDLLPGCFVFWFERGELIQFELVPECEEAWVESLTTEEDRWLMRIKVFEMFQAECWFGYREIPRTFSSKWIDQAPFLANIK